MKAFVFFCLVACSLAAVKETTLASDAANPYGASELIEIMNLNTPLNKYSKLYSSLPRNMKSYSTSIDHRSWVGPVKQQSWTSEETDVGCGSCVTFSAIASAEIAYYAKFKKIANFSEMELVDCMYKAGGCNGNYMANAIKHIYNNGVTTRKDYPYTPTDLNVCESTVKRYYKNKFVPFEINPKVAAEYKTFIKNYGGFSVQYWSGAFTKNKDGIVTACKGSESNSINHAVAAVGYGSINGVEYLLIRNSWGATAANHENGYFKLKVGACNSNKYSYMGFVFDSCYSYTSKNTCSADALCNWSLGKCKNKYIKMTTKIANVLKPVASAADKLIDKLNGVGLSNIPTSHILRKSTLIGSEFMCFLKKANKNTSLNNVYTWFNKAANNGSINKSTGKIINYASLRKLLGISKAFTVTLATKKSLNEKYQALDEYRFYILKVTLSTKYWDARHNQNETPDVFRILGSKVDGKLTLTK